MTAHALAALLPIIELDGALVGQFMLARPLVVGALFGLALGEPMEGLTMGAVIEAFSTEEPPVGGRVPLNATVAAGVGVLVPLAPALALPVGLLAGWAHARGEQAVRQRRSALGARAETGESWASVIGRSLGLQAAWTAAVTALFLLAVAPAAAWAWRLLPEAARVGAGLAWTVAPWLAVAVLLKAFRRSV